METISSSSSCSSMMNAMDLEKKRRRPTYQTRSAVRYIEMVLEQEDESNSLIYSYTLDPYDFEDDELVHMSVHMFQHFDLPRIFRFSLDSLREFFLTVRGSYNPSNEFHNFKHAWAVMHLCFQILIHGGEKFLNTLDIFSVLIGAICHDIRHPGNNNAFELAIGSEISKLFSQPNEVCVLEKFHARVTVELMGKGKHRHDILTGLTESERSHLTSKVQYIILGTDMGKHKALVEDAALLAEFFNAPGTEIGFMECKSSSGSTSNDSSPKRNGFVFGSGKISRSTTPRPESFNSEFRSKITRLIVHCADIGAQTQDKEIAMKWAIRCYAEFNSQANKEESLGIVTAAFLHDLKEDSKKFADQYSFIHNVVQPIWDKLTLIFPQLRFAFDQLVSNKLGYREYI